MTGSQPTPGDESAGSEGLAEASAPFGTEAAAPLAAPPPIVAIGASAGGLEAIEQFFAAVDAPSRFAFAVIQALSPDFQSLMVELLAKRTALTVRVVEDGMAPAADAIHLIPPGRTMTIEGGRFCLADRDPRDLVHHPIDEFFVSLASDRGSSAIGVLLSGSGSDGSRGARAIRAAGGRVLVQEPKTATFATMPQNAIEAGCHEEVMAPDAMAAALLAAGPRPQQDLDPEPTSTLPPALAACLDQAFGLDFSLYRNSTVQHRVHRRMMLRGFDRLDAYTGFVADDPDEQEALYQDLLIGTTGFCRDPAAFVLLEREVAPALASQLDAGEEVRLWVPACATGEEAYALAMLVLDQCQEPLESLPLRIFATDVHRRSLGIAGAGFYSEEATADLRPEWRQRFLGRRGSGWQVDQAVRRTITFSPNDLLRDPPVTRVPLISCRNFLGYLEPAAQDRVLAGFADALLPGGHLLLGSGETAARHADSFAALDPDLPLYRKKRGAAASERGSLVASALPPPGPPLTVGPGRGPSRERRDQRLTMAHERLLDRYVPPSLLVDEAGQVIHCFGDAGAYLKPPRGRPSLAVLDMVKDPLRAPLASAINRVKRTGRPITLARLALARGPDAPLLPRLVVDAPNGRQDGSGRQDGQRCLLVSFDDRPVAGDGHAKDDPQAGLDHATLARLEELERDLRFGEENLKDTIETLEAANTALEARNRDLLTANEEVRTSLDALRTAGSEHQRRIDILLRLGQEFESLIEAANLAALLLDPDLSIRRFTPAATRYVNLLPQDTGRPLAHVTHHFADTDIVALLRTAATSGAPASHDVQTTDGSPVRLAITPLLAPGRSIRAIILCIQGGPFPNHPPPPS